MSVDNRYTGVGYEPPFETPSDKDFMAAHIEELESRVRELEAERDRLIENISTLLAQRKEAQHKSIAAMMEVATLRSRHAALVEELKEEKQWSARLLETREQFSKELGQCHQARKVDYENHAALVRAIGKCSGMLKPGINEEVAAMDELKAALAEVK